MGILRRLLGRANEVALDPVTDVVLAVTPSIRRVRKLDEAGTPANGVVTGIAFDLNGDTTRRQYAITVDTPAGPRRIGVRFSPTEFGHRLRLGVPVVVKLDGDRGILDWESMARAWGIPASNQLQESARTPPADGLVDRALDSRVQKHLEAWAPERGRIADLDRRSVFGMPTLNWDVSVRLTDGAIAVSRGDEVPSYAQWDAAIGADVPVVVNPKDRSQVSIDWPRFARERADTSGFDDDPPAGSIAQSLEQGRA